MALPAPEPARSPSPRRSYVRPPEPLHFPVEERVPEGEVHFKLRALLLASVERELRGRTVLASESFVYWHVRDDPELGATLRLSRDVAGADLVLTPFEAERAKEAAIAGREAATARVAELEAALSKRR